MKRKNNQPGVLNAQNVRDLLKTLRAQISDDPLKLPYDGLLLPLTYPIISNRYRGVGRPRKSDYDRKEFDWKGLGLIQVKSKLSPL